MTDPSKPLSDVIVEFLSKKRLSPTSRRDYTHYLHRFDAFVRHGDVSQLTLDNAIRWRHELIGTSLHVAKLGTSILRSLAKWACQNGYRCDPITGRSVLLGLETTRTPATRRKPFTDDQLEAIWTALTERESRSRLRALVYARLLYCTGLGKGTVRGLLRRNVDLNTRWVTASVTNRRSGRVEMKRMRLSRTCASVIDDYLKSAERPAFRGRPPEPLFLTEDGDTFAVDGFNTWVENVGQDVRDLSGIPWNSETMRLTAEAHAESKIRDPDLRRRCAGLLEADSDHDRAIAAACVVLEDRVRARSRAPANLIGDDLMRWAFDGTAPRLQLATHPTEQGGALNLYRGTSAFYRNGTAHRMRSDDFDPDEAFRVVSWIDHLLGLID